MLQFTVSSAFQLGYVELMYVTRFLLRNFLLIGECSDISSDAFLKTEEYTLQCKGSG
jgi:hypothetical protein